MTGAIITVHLDEDVKPNEIEDLKRLLWRLKGVVGIGGADSNGDGFALVQSPSKPRRKRKPRPPFQKPTREMVRAYCAQRGNDVDADRWYDHYERVDWVVGKNQTPMRDWQAAVRTWEKPKDSKGGDQWQGAI